MPPPVTYALLALCAAVLVAGLWLGGKSAEQRWPRLSRASMVITLAPLFVAWLVLRPGQGDDLSVRMREAAERQQPLFVDLYSNF